MIHASRKLVLGIDIGTTKVAAALVDAETREVFATASLAHESDVRGLPVGRSEQVVARILASLDDCVLSLPQAARAHVRAVGVTGQMHGVVLWNAATGETSNLVTWQDQRCLEEDFIEELRSRTGDATCQSGYGLSTLSWLAKYEPAMLQKYNRAATIHDYLVTAVCGNERAYTDPSDGASWGLFDLRARSWNVDKISRSGIPIALLPEIVEAGAHVGVVTESFAARWGIPSQVPVGNALGDNQASLFGSLTDAQHQIALTIGTGAQLSVMVSDLPAELPGVSSTFEFRPYVGSKYIAVAASLTGGRALAALAKAIEYFMSKMNVSPVPSLDAIQTAMHVEGLAAIATDLQANASLSGERYDLSMRGSFTNLSFDNFTFGDMTCALSRGLVSGLRDALPATLLADRSEVVGSGNAIRRSPLMQQVIRESFGCSLVLTEGSETTACGAALLAASQLA